jgi:hypothetical protein
MVEDEDYIEVEAVIRMPRGERLADSKKTEGWSRGFTPKSSDKGPEHVEIRLKDDGEGWPSNTGPAEPQFIFIDDNSEQPRQKTREQQELEELVGALLLLGLVKAVQWAQPRLQRLWNEHVIPFFTARLDDFNAKRDQRQKRKAQRRARKHVTTEVPTIVTEGVPVDETNGVSAALEAYETNMTSAEARQHFAEAIVAQHFAKEKMRLLANARIKDNGLPPELASAVKSLTPKQVENALDSILASRPTLLDDLARFLEASRNEGQLQLGSDRMKAVLRLTDGGRGPLPSRYQP